MTVSPRTWRTKRGSRTSWCYDFTHQGTRHSHGGFETRAIAQQAEAVARARLVDARLARDYGIRPRAAHVPTVRRFLEGEYLDEMRSTLEASTISRRRSILGIFAASYGQHRLSALTAADLAAYRDQRARLVSGGMARKELTTIGTMLKAAQRRGYVGDLPTKGLPLPPENPLHDRILSEDEEARLYAALPTDMARDAFGLAFWCCLRRSELAGLRGRDVDLPGRRLTIRQAKTGQEKVIPLVKPALEILQRHPAIEEAPIFRSRYRKAFSSDRLGSTFRRAVLAAGLDGFRPHDLRHTLATRLLQAGYDIPTVGSILGHRPPYRATMRYVAHTSEGRKREALESLTQTKHGKEKHN
jgi:integrase